MVLVLYLIGCNNKPNASKEEPPPFVTDTKPTTEDDCILKPFQVTYPNNIEVHSSYYTCEPEWKSSLIIYKDGKILFKTDSIVEYEFVSMPQPTHIADGQYEYLLIERNDRPALNKIDVFRINRAVVDTVYSIPRFEFAGKDIDNDGITEYFATMEFTVFMGKGNIGYNPLLVYEIEADVLRFDTTTTINLNKKAYGDFYGYKRLDTLLFDGNQVEKNWPYDHL